MSAESGKARAEQVTQEMDIITGGSWRRVVSDAVVFQPRRGGQKASFAVLKSNGVRSTINLPATRTVRVRPAQLPAEPAAQDSDQA